MRYIVGFNILYISSFFKKRSAISRILYHEGRGVRIPVKMTNLWETWSRDKRTKCNGPQQLITDALLLFINLVVSY